MTKVCQKSLCYSIAMSAIYRMRAVADNAEHTLFCMFKLYEYWTTWSKFIWTFICLYFCIIIRAVLIAFLRVRLNETNKQTNSWGEYEKQYNDGRSHIVCFWTDCSWLQLLFSKNPVVLLSTHIYCTNKLTDWLSNFA